MLYNFYAFSTFNVWIEPYILSIWWWRRWLYLNNTLLK